MVIAPRPACRSSLLPANCDYSGVWPGQARRRLSSHVVPLSRCNCLGARAWSRPCSVLICCQCLLHAVPLYLGDFLAARVLRRQVPALLCRRRSWNCASLSRSCPRDGCACAQCCLFQARTSRYPLPLVRGRQAPYFVPLSRRRSLRHAATAQFRSSVSPGCMQYPWFTVGRLTRACRAAFPEL